MKKIVINVCFGGFSLSPKAILLYAKLKCKPVFGYIKNPEHVNKAYDKQGYIRYNPQSTSIPFIVHWLWTDLGDVLDDIDNGAEWVHDRDIPRHDKNLVLVVERLGKASGGLAADLKVVEIPEDVEYIIQEYDGLEHIAEKHRTWN